MRAAIAALLIALAHSSASSAAAPTTAIWMPTTLVTGKTLVSVTPQTDAANAVRAEISIDGAKAFARDRRQPFTGVLDPSKLTPGKHMLISRTKFTYPVSGSKRKIKFSIARRTFKVSKQRTPAKRRRATSPNALTAPALRGKWSLEFDDEFGGFALDTSKWCSSWFHESVLDSTQTDPKNVSVSGGNLSLNLSSPQSGALVNTNPSDCGIPGYRFGTGHYVEARIKFPGNGQRLYNWSGWWTNGENWPGDGEADIAETLNEKLMAVYHSSTVEFYPQIIPGEWANKFHTYALLRERGYNSIYYDNALVAKYPTDDAGAPHYLVLHIAAGDRTKPLTKPGTQTKVSWVRVWKRQ